MQDIEQYAEHMAVQLRKGFLAYCVLKICEQRYLYTSDIISRLKMAQMVVVEGTIYPLLSRLSNDGLLEYQWQESESGPPRKYYRTTADGSTVARILGHSIHRLEQTIKKL